MKVKNIMLITLVLLAVLTVGAVSASDNNETLIVSEIGGGQNSDFSTSQDDFNINVTEKNFNNNEGSLSADKEDIIGDYSPDDFNVFNKESKVAIFEEWREIVGFNTPNDFTGELTLNITNGSGDFKEYSLDIPGNGNEIRRNLGDFDFIDSVGVYELSLIYRSGTQVFEIDYWNLTVYYIDYFYYNEESSGYLNVKYPYEIITLNWNDYPIKRYEIYVGGNPEPFAFDGSCNIIFLSDLGIDSAGNYGISIKTFDENDDEVEEFVFSLDVKNLNESEFKANVILSGRSVNYGADIIRIYCPVNAEGNLIFDFEKYGDEGLIDSFQREFPISNEMNGTWTSWNISGLEIDGGSYSLKIRNGDNEFSQTFINLDEGNAFDIFYNQENIRLWDSYDWEILGFSVYGLETGTVYLIYDNQELTSWNVEYGKYLEAHLNFGDLNIGEVGKYDLSLKFVSRYQEFEMFNWTLNVNNLDYQIYNDPYYNNINLEYPYDIIIAYGYDGLEINRFEISVNGNDALVFENEKNRFNLTDLKITSQGVYNISITSFDVYDDVIETFNCTLNVVELDRSNFRANVIFDNILNNYKDDVVRVYCPSEAQGVIVFDFERYDDGFRYSFEIPITDEMKGEWTFFKLDDLNNPEPGNYGMSIANSSEVFANSCFNVGCYELLYYDVWNEDEILYLDNPDCIVRIYCPEEVSGKLSVFVDTVEKFRTNIYSDSVYEWDLKSLGITEEGYFNVTLKFQNDYGEVTNKEYYFNVSEFKNDTFRAKVMNVEEHESLYFFSPANKIGTITLVFENWNDDNDDFDYVDTVILELNETHWNKWTYLSDMLGSNVEVKVNDTDIYVEYPWGEDIGNWFDATEDEIYPGDAAIWVYVSDIDNNYTINVTSGNYTFFKKISELGEYEWSNGNYKYLITIEDLDMFRTINDKDKVFIFLDANDSFIRARWLPYLTFTIEKTENYTKLHYYEDLRIDLVKIELVGFELTGDGFVPGNYEEENVPQEETQFVRITVPDSLNITETGNVHISYGNQYLTKQLSDLVYEYNYNCLGKDYYVLLGDLNLANLKDKDVVNVSVTSNDELLGSNRFVMHLTDEGWEFDYFQDSIDLRFYYGQIGNLEFGVSGDPDAIIELTIPEYLNISEGTIIINDENGEVIFSKSLSEFEDEYKSYDGYQSYSYWISDNITEFDYSCFKQNVSFTVSFSYGNNTTVFAKGIRIGDKLCRINTPSDVENYFKITISDNVLINDTDNVIVIEATDRANRQSIAIGLGSGYFVVYVNGVKIENLGRLVRVENETELELFRLTGGSEGSTKLYIYLSDLNVTENGIYNIRVAHHSDDYRDGTAAANSEIEVFNKNVTLTSNVKANYQNDSVVWLTGYGLDPVLVYLDTYYGQIDDVTGKITVLNANGDVILSKNINELALKDGRRYLSYSDFTNNFSDKITLKYSNGNERNGETDMNVLWRNIVPEDFSPSVDDNVNDYYGNFINLIIPDTVNDGEIIVTIKFKNNHDTNISNMDVNTNFNSEAVYTFNIADIKASFGNNFALTFNDLGFYEDDGNYSIDVKFTADNTSFLNITNKTISVELLECILISINETSRYGIVAPFASIRIFEPLNAYGELYIDDVLYAHKTFEKGWIIFDSSKTWTPGVHTAEVKVFNSEFGSLLNSSKATFKTLIKTDDVNVYVNTTIKENENAIIIITVPQAGNLTVIVDNGEKTIYPLVDGQNTIDLGQLSQGNHTVWIEYVNNESTSFYNNYIIITVGDDGSWLDFPERIELNGRDTIKINVGEGAEGYVLIYIDDVLVANRTLENGTLEISLTQYLTGENIYGMHNYTIIYYDNNGNMIFSRNGTFYVTYIFHDNIGNEPVPLQDVYIFIVTLPYDATGNVTITITGDGFKQSYTEPVVNGQAIFYIYDLPLGEYDILVEYSGDAKYPPSSYHTLLNVSYYGIVGDFRDGKRIISLRLPENATGNLVVYNDNRRSELDSVSMVNGRAKVDLTNVPVGIYEIRAVYDGSDYEVKSFSTTFKVLPEVIIAQGITIGENGTIFMDLDGATGYILVVIEGAKPEVHAIVDGKLNYTYSTEGFVKGNHTITFQYFGESFDGNVFYTFDEKTGYYVPIEYSVEILPIKVSPKEESNNDTELIIYIYDENGNFLPDAGGRVEITVLNNFTGEYQTFIVDVVNGIARLSLDGLKDGDYSITWDYLGDNRYGSFSRELLLSIKHKQAKITAGDLTMIYTDASKYTVTVYTKDGKLAGNVAVIFFINDKAYGNVMTDNNGVASILIDLAPGSYKITAAALGVSVTKKLTVSKILSLKTAKVKRSAKKLVLKATLKKVKGKYLKGKKITFKFNGKKYAAKTNKKGVAKVTIKKKVLKKLKKGKKVTYQATYLKDTVKKTAKIKK